METYSVKKDDLKPEWFVVDASGRVLGQLATEIACLLMGKGKVKFARHLNVGDYVVVVNASQVKVTGNKMKNKFYYRHSGYPGGFKAETMEKVMSSKPERIIEHAVKGMLPQNKIGQSMMGRLKVYPGSEHPHKAQVRIASNQKA